jgi:ribosomal protein S18 acetylase RimI-like enzyme
MTTSCTVRVANVHDLPLLVPLFDGYRQFYGQPADPALAERFLSDRFSHQESQILIALNDQEGGLGFTQLYPLFSSTQACRTYLLNDLFVVPEARRSGVARSLLAAAARHARALGASALSLSTAHGNLQAQRLYESLGWQLETEFREYSLAL